MLWDVSPTETPFITACGKGKATGTAHDWLTDSLEDAAANSQIEGNDATPAEAASRFRLSNYTNILTKDAVVTGTQEKVLKGGGIKSEMAYQVARRMKAIKRDLELMCVGVTNSKVAGDDTTPREMGSFNSYLGGGPGNLYDSCWQTMDGLGVAPAGNGDATGLTSGVPAPLDEPALKLALSQLWEQSGGNENILGITGSFNRSAVSDFTASSTRYVTTDDKKLVASIDVYDGDFHTVTMSPDRFTDPAILYLVDPEYVKVADLRPLFTHDLATTGDAAKKQLVWETTLEVCNPLAHVALAGLTVA
jgi:hypothetical protein